MLKDGTSFTFTVKGITTEGDTVVIEGEPRAESQDEKIQLENEREYIDSVAIPKFTGAKVS